MDTVTWEQLAMEVDPVDVVEVQLRIGVVRSARHGQWAIRVAEGEEARLVGMVSMHHVDLATNPAPWRSMLDELATVLARVYDPF